MAKPKTTTLYCFSPPVMIATFAVEIALAVFVWLRRRHTGANMVIFATLLCLALFQAAEYQTCGATDSSKLIWSRIGFVAITLLPPLGVDLIARIGKKAHRLAIGVSYSLAFVFIAIFTLAPQAINAAVCGGNYIIFHLQDGLGWWYGGYYYGVILLSLMLAAQHGEEAKDKRTARAVRWFIGGVLAFLVPTATVNAFYPETIAGIPSIMCGFAALYALVLALRISPLISKKA